MIEALTVTVVEEPSKELIAVVTDCGLTPESAHGLLSDFKPFFTEANKLAEEARALSVTDATQVTEIKKSRAIRLALREIRIGAEKKRKSLKEDSLRRGRAIDGVNAVLLYLVEPLETKLQENEEFAERAEAKRKEDLCVARWKIVADLGADPKMYALGEMKEDVFVQLVDGIRLAKEAKLAAEKKAADELAAKQKEEAEERERIRLENERLKKEAEEKEASLKAERERVAEERRVAEEKAANDKKIADEKAAEERRVFEAKLAEERRISDEKAETAKQERIAFERKARLQQDEAEKKAKDLRDAEAAKAKAERDRLQAEIDAANKKAADAEAERVAVERRRLIDEKAAKDLEDSRIAAELAEKKKAELRPEKDKLAAYAVAIRALPRPALTSDEGKLVAIVIDQQVEKFAAFIEQKAGAL